MCSMLMEPWLPLIKMSQSLSMFCFFLASSGFAACENICTRPWARRTKKSFASSTRIIHKVRCVGRSCRVGCEISSSIARHVIILDKRKQRSTRGRRGWHRSSFPMRHPVLIYARKITNFRFHSAAVNWGMFTTENFRGQLFFFYAWQRARRGCWVRGERSEHEKRNSIFFADSKKKDTN